MNKNKLFIISILVIFSMLSLSACGTISQAIRDPGRLLAQVQGTATSEPVQQNTQPITTPAATATVASSQPNTIPIPVTGQAANPALLSAYEGTLEAIYSQVSPSIVSIHVVEGGSAANNSSPFGQGQGGPQVGEALGSGFIWDNQGHIVTNNHVVAGSSTIDVTFTDGRNVEAKVVGTDPYSDLGVIQIDTAGLNIKPITLADSKLVKVGEMAVAIGNPFGLQSTMTVGIISALGRTLPAGEGNTTGPTYSIPDIIQTDAAINPGNSGGALLNSAGQLIGVTTAIESNNSGTNSGVGFVIPSAIVRKVVPELIQSGHYDHSYLGISGTTLSPALAKAMNLQPSQQGALVEDVVSGGPGDKAGLRASSRQATINGQQATVGGDVVTKIDGQPVTTMDDLIAYLADSTSVSQKVTLTILRDGKEQTLDVTLGVRPAQGQDQTGLGNSNNNNNNGGNQAQGSAYLGVGVVPVDATIAKAMNLSANQRGLLVAQVDPNGPAGQAGLQAGSQTIDDNGQQVPVGGDIILQVNGHATNTLNALRQLLSQVNAGDDVMLTVLRDGKQQQLTVTTGAQPTTNP
jgi:serine protease Do